MGEEISNGSVEPNNGGIKTIMDLFEKVDQKICSLHECSGEDFNAFNDRLKDYNNKVREITQNANKILEIIDGD